MRKINLKGKIGGAILALSLFGGIGMMSGVNAQAQDRNDSQWRGRDRNNEARNERNARSRDDRDDHNNGYSSSGGYDRNRSYGNTGNYGRYGGYSNNGGYDDAYQVAQSQGYQAGVNTGANDAERGQSYSPQRSHYFREASSQAFRDGFVQGYDQGYRQYAGYNNGGGYQRGNTNNSIGVILGSIFGRP